MGRLTRTTSFGEHLRSLRENKGLTLKTVAERIGIDTSLLARIERNERQASKNVIEQVADLFKCDVKELQNDLLSDLIANKIIDEQADINVLRLAEKKVRYLKNMYNER